MAAHGMMGETKSFDAGSVLVVDDDKAMRTLIADILGGAGFATREATSGEEAILLARRDAPALAMLDVQLPGISGYEVCRALRSEFGESLPIVFVSGHRTEPQDRVAGLLIGADDYIPKPFSPDELLARVRRLARRAFPSTRMIASKLTGREREVLRFLAVGLGPNDIADRLFISPRTVGTHIEHIFLKLGVQTRAQAVAVAYRNDLVEAQTEIPSIGPLPSPDLPPHAEYRSNGTTGRTRPALARAR
jgi:DNA-binding NarL/FixJ family response regulator